MMYTPQRKVPQSLRALAREKGKVVTCLPLPALEEGKVQPPPMIPEEAIHAKALEVISGGGGEVVPSDGDIWRHFHPKVHWICPHWSKKIRLHCKLRYQLWNLRLQLYGYQFNMGLLLLQRKEWQKQMDEQKSTVTESQEMLQQ
jgi:hypothetical protein